LAKHVVKLRRGEESDEFVPKKLHLEKMAEMKRAERIATEALLAVHGAAEEEEDECLDVETALRLDELEESDKDLLVKRLVEWYKEKPSQERARLFRDLSNHAASVLAGISSKTMVKARKENYEPPPRKSGRRKTKAGLSGAQIDEIAQKACLDGRFCEVRSWVSHAGEKSERHFEAVGLVDVRTMWSELCREHGEDFCSLRTFYNHLPDFYVHKKKERCVCKRCKKGRRYLDNVSVLVRAMKRTAEEGSELEQTLKTIRVHLIELYGHLEKELVLEVADKCHSEQCWKCELLESMPMRLLEVGKRKPTCTQSTC